jgi:hypothetical protein
MLDWAHRLALEAVQDGGADASVALDDLVASGLVVRAGDSYHVTDAGRAALAASRPSRAEAWSWRVLAASGIALAVGIALGWLTG